MDNFLTIIKNPTKSIEKRIDLGKTRKVMKNLKNIVPIIEAIFLRGRQNPAFSGHRDSGKIFACSYSKMNNEGTFKEILRYRC